jgi:DMSO/TMAO reductase YedYZ molybdopterin-dependent catalytic subunit
MKNTKAPPLIMERTLTRRSLLDWLGKAAVFSLGGDFLAGCIENVNDVFGGQDGAPDDTEDAGMSQDCESFGDAALSPGDESQAIFDGFTEYTVDPQDLEQILKTWSLRVDGLVENQIDLSFSDLIKLPRQDQITDFHCAVGWSVYDVPWNGVHLKTLFDIVKPTTGAVYVSFHTMGDIYNESLLTNVALEPKTLLAYGVDCATLPLPHGFPARLVVPRKLGYKNAKYVYRIELSDTPLLGYWEQHGYQSEGDVPEGRLRPGKY